ncbi:acyltransferase [Bradyrhizobium sp. AUGA SZCCT0160]|uniref:acyltransferase family protein n=1 Tax=Bradyrhizobium sp. AUGA SZCCT0160 TaxID=2807662 RepID=UPI001BA5E37D|nr:acyltransferase [Bradyrhizobium sp. AUGA SZCCT0160]MBR1193248.1 acyltransferase [Bradyrhizobium sp. AUGA SZCCT0160]
MGIVRFLLALCVVAEHTASHGVLGVQLLSGTTAVQCFYVISGFLITMVLNERAGYRSLGNFYLSRYFRLWPVYIVVAVASLYVVYWDVMFTQLPKVADWPAVAFVAISNLTLFFQDWFLFLRLDGSSLLPTSDFASATPPPLHGFLLVPQCWSIGVELTFYVIAPFVCRSWRGLSLLFAFGLASRIVTAALDLPPDPWMYRFAPSEMLLFSSGGLAYFAGRNLCPRYPLTTKVACVLAMASIGAVVLGLPLTNRYSAAALDHLLILNGPALVLMTVAAAPLFYATRNSVIDRFIGELSYPMYVSHLLIQTMLTRQAPSMVTPDNLLYVAVVVTVSALLVLGIVYPIDSLRKRLASGYTTSRKSLVPAPAE